MYYRANDSVLNAIGKFEEDYKPESSILWYKSDSFVYRLLNRVMRQQNIAGILTFRFFILDLFRKLNKMYHEFIDQDVYEDNTNYVAYRGQLMFNDEFESLRKSLKYGTIISINSFFSTSRSREVALRFSGCDKAPSQNIRSVLFEIDINIDLKMQLKRKPFADVGFLSSDEDNELEIIFMVGSFFQINEIIENKETEMETGDKTKVTLIKLTLINEDDSNVLIMKDFRSLKSTKTMQGKLIRIGNLLTDYSLSKESQSFKVDRYYTSLSNDINLNIGAACLTGQAWAAFRREQYDLAEERALKALSMDDNLNNELTITTLNCLGGVYSKQKNWSKALKYYQQAYDLSKPTDDKLKNGAYDGPCIPIDKYAMYDNYRNISSINIGCIYQKTGEIQRSWDIYKEAVDCEMRDTTDFHCHTCMTIAESGTHEKTATREELTRAWTNWKHFLGLGLVDMLKYRTPAITGYLSFSHQYDFPSRRYNNFLCQKMAIKYFQQVEKLCSQYAFNREYYLYTLQCYERLATLYGYQSSRSIEYYEKMIRLCLKYCPDDLDNIIIGYQGMIETYKKQLSNEPHSLQDIPVLLCANTNDVENTSVKTPLTPPVTPITPPMTPIIPSTTGKLFHIVKHLHFAFNKYDKWIDPRLESEPDLSKKIIYCHLKLAALFYDKKKIEDSKRSLKEAKSLCEGFGSQMVDVTKICIENRWFIDKNFDPVIESYKARLPTMTDTFNHCLDEDKFCYIALLYERNNDFRSSFEFLQKPIKYFEEYDYVCEHTIECYIKLAKYYQTIKIDKESTINTYERAIHIVKKHRQYPMIRTISIVEQHLIRYFKDRAHLNTTILVYETLCRIIEDEATDIVVLYQHLKRILKLLVDKTSEFSAIVSTYDDFLNYSLEIINPLTSQMAMVLIHFRDEFINRYIYFNELPTAIKIYQKLLCLLFEHQTDTMKITKEYKTIAARFMEKRYLEDSVKAYENLLDFACKHHSTAGFIEGDLINFVFYIWKNQIIKQYLMDKNFDSAINLHHKVILFLDKYRANVNINYSLDEFILKTLQSYDEIAEIYQLKKNNFDQTINTYQEKIHFLTKYQVEIVQEYINSIFLKCEQFAADNKEKSIALYSKLVLFISRNRLQYLPDLLIAYKDLSQLNRTGNQQQLYPYTTSGTRETNCSSDSARVNYLNQRICEYKQKAKRYLDTNRIDKAILVYRNELLPFLLENHTRDDYQISTCYTQMALSYWGQGEQNIEEALKCYKNAIDIYQGKKDHFYTKYAFQLNPNVCRRYVATLFMCYNFMKRIYIELGDENSVEIYNQKAIDIYENHKDQFQFCANSTTNTITIEILPMVELGY